MLEIKQIDTKNQWDSFLALYTGFYPFFQLWEWGDVQASLGFNVYRFGIFEGEKICGLSQIIEINARRGHYLHVRHGPVVSLLTSELIEAYVAFLKQFAKEKNCSFVRISPLLVSTGDTDTLLKKYDFISSPIHNMDSEVCWVLDITKSEEDLLKEMRKTHRYLVKKAQGMGVVISQTTTKEDRETFLSFYQELSQKKHFVPHKGIVQELEILGKYDEVALFIGRFEGKIVTGAVIVFVGDMAIYHHAASDSKFRHIPASYLLQWEVIKEAKRRGKRLYNFWGIAPEGVKNHPWQGHTLFKTGFGGEKREFLHAHDLPLSLFYWKTYAIELLSKIRKGY